MTLPEVSLSRPKDYGSAMPRMLLDIEPLRVYPEFRRVWIGYAAAAIGSQMSVVAIALEVYRITGSNLDVGLISLIQLVPAIFGSLVGGSFADAMDRRKLLVITGTLMALFSIGLALNADRTHPSLVVVYLLAGINAGFQGVNSPALTAVLISIVNRDMMVKANALRQLSAQVASVLGPTLAGVLLPFGIHFVFWANAATFMIAIAAVLTAGSHPPTGGATRFGWTSIVEGLAFLKGRQAIQGCFIADLSAMVLGMPTSLFPALALHHFHGGDDLLGILYAAPGFGALVASMVSGWTSRVRRPGRAVVIAITIWGLGIAGFGLIAWFPGAVILLAMAGGADVISAVFRSTILQTQTPDRLRGRLSALQQAVVTSGPRLGNGEAGIVAALTNTEISVVSGGIGCLIGIAIVAKTMPKFVHYDLNGPDRFREATTIVNSVDDDPAPATP
jgi:MFS family permease